MNNTLNGPRYMVCPILSTKDRRTYCDTKCMAFMVSSQGFGCKLINQNSEKESWHKQ